MTKRKMVAILRDAQAALLSAQETLPYELDDLDVMLTQRTIFAAAAGLAEVSREIESTRLRQLAARQRREAARERARTATA